MKRAFIFLLLVALAVAAVSLWPRAGRRAAGALPHDAYVWQRAWTEPVRAAIAQRATNFTGLIALNAEVSWKNREPHVTRVAIDHAALRECGRPVGLALRIGPYAGPFDAEGEISKSLGRLAAQLVAEATSNHLAVVELQIDFDCAASKLDGYRVWVESFRRRIAPVPVTITALPSWLKQRSFARLAAATDGYVLQVHSVERPRSADAPFTLCDPAAAREAVEQAGKLGVPFRVALPTYGYLMAFDRAGKFIGLSAEGPSPAWPEGTRIREARSDPTPLAGLVAGWSRDRPESLRGLIWYRLPIFQESLNWRWSTLSVVMAGIAPRSGLHAEARHPRPGLVEVDVSNAGEADFSRSVQITLRWQGARLVASDGVRGFVVADGDGAVKFSANQWRLPAGERRTIGWARFDQETGVQIEIEETDAKRN